MRNKNITAGIFLTALGLAYGYLTAGLPERSLPNMPGPSFFPWVLTFCLLVLSVSLVVQGLRMAEDAPKPAGKAGGSFPAVVFLGVFAIYLALLPFLGFLPASIPFFAVLMVMYGETRKLWVASFSFGVPIFLFLLFRNVFDIPLPRGSLSLVESALSVLS
ncbi:MAG: tripartite tricarboxylate transporter TctB family protein [Proteobacteria bacterium]|nr:tripartite tricarboxylate transporter TctB family protein [Pseudomonadota bacterium]